MASASPASPPGGQGPRPDGNSASQEDEEGPGSEAILNRIYAGVAAIPPMPSIVFRVPFQQPPANTAKANAFAMAADSLVESTLALIKNVQATLPGSSAPPPPPKFKIDGPYPIRMGKPGSLLEVEVYCPGDQGQDLADAVLSARSSIRCIALPAPYAGLAKVSTRAELREPVRSLLIRRVPARLNLQNLQDIALYGGIRVISGEPLCRRQGAEQTCEWVVLAAVGGSPSFDFTVPRIPLPGQAPRDFHVQVRPFNPLERPRPQAPAPPPPSPPAPPSSYADAARAPAPTAPTQPRAKAAAKAKVAKPARTPKATKAPAAGPSPAIATRVPAPAPDAGPAASPPRGAAESPEEPPPRGPAAASAPPHMAMDSQPAAAAAVPGDPGSDSDSLAGRAPRKRPRRASASAKAPILSAMSQQAAIAEMEKQGGADSFVARRQSKRLSSRQLSSRSHDTMAVSPEIGAEGASPFPPLSNPFAVLNDVDPGDNAGSASPVGGSSHAD